MNYTIIDKKYRSRVVDFEGHELVFRDYQATASPELAYRISRTIPDDFIIQDVDETVSYNPDSWKKDRRMIWSGNFSVANGFGMVAENTVKHLIEANIIVRSPGRISGGFVTGGEYVDEKIKFAFAGLINPDCLEIQHCQPPAIRWGIVERIWVYTMFETTHTPNRWIKLLNKLEHVLVPTKWLVDSWKEQGVKVPIDVYGHGINPEFLYYVDRPIREPYTFLHYCQLSARKGTELVVRAFQEEFRGDDGARLILKNIYPIFPVPLGIKNVEYLAATYDKRELLQLLSRADCFVFPTRGEGFGLPPFEAMATGLPTIVTGWSGPVDYSDPYDTLILNYKMVRSHDFDAIYKNDFMPNENSGTWAEPDFEHLKHYMRWCYEHREEAKAKGKKAAERIASKWTWQAKVNDLISVIDKYA